LVIENKKWYEEELVKARKRLIAYGYTPKEPH
jgi:hypothetical protein